MSVNKAILMGNVCADPRIKNFDDGGKVAQFSLATNKRAYKTKDGRDIPEQTEFHNIVINRKGLAEVAEKFVRKGNKVYIEGELRTRQYDDSGATRFVTEVYATEMELLTPKEKQGQAPPPPPQQDNYTEDIDPITGRPMPL